MTTARASEILDSSPKIQPSVSVRNARTRQPSKKELRASRARRQIEAINDNREFASLTDYL